MIKIGTVGYVCQIEQEIKKLPHDVLWDGSEPVFDFLGNKPPHPFKIQDYIRIYEVFENEKAKHDVVLWYHTRQAYVKFHYDNRNNQASVEMKDKSYAYLCQKLPSLRDMIIKLWNGVLKDDWQDVFEDMDNETKGR